MLRTGVDEGETGMDTALDTPRARHYPDLAAEGEGCLSPTGPRPGDGPAVDLPHPPSVIDAPRR